MQIEPLSRAYGVPVIDYERAGRDLLISSGAGSMMAVMDECPTFRWCVDIDRIEKGRVARAESRLYDWLLWMPRLVDRIGVVGWFSLTDPAPLRRALEQLDAGLIYAYTPGVELPAGVACETLEEFVDTFNAAARIAA